MNTIWDGEHEARLARIKATPGRADTIERAYRNVPQEIRDFTFQHSTRGPNIADKEVAVEMLTALASEALAFIHFEVGEGPHPNEDADANNEALAGFPAPWSAFFNASTQVWALDCDGKVSWSEPVTMFLRDRPVTVTPGSVPLEVGYMPSGKAIYGMKRTGLARWPYGSDTLTVILPLAPHMKSTA